MTTQQIKQLIETELNIEINAKSRKRENVYARAIYFKICRDKTYLSLKEIGDTLKLNHATVLHGINKVFPTFEIYNPEYMEVYRKIKNSEEYIPVEDRYNTLKEDYYKLQSKYDSIKDAKTRKEYNSLVKIIKEIPEEKLDVANLRIDAMVKMLKTY